MTQIQRYAGLIPLLVFLAACSGNGSATSESSDETGGTLTVSVQGVFGRTAIPVDLDVSSYRLTGTGPDSKTLAAQTSPTGSFTVKSLAPGDWIVLVEALDGSGNSFLSGSATVSITASGVTNASVSMAPIFAGNGSLTLSLSWPAARTVDEIAATLTRTPGGAVQNLSFAISGHAASCDFSSVATGAYFLKIELKTSGIKVARTITDTAIVYVGKTSVGSFALTDEDFGTGVTVTYSGNGAETGTVPLDGNFYASGSSATVLGNSGGLWRRAYSFAGWNTKADGFGVTYAEGSDLTMGTDDAILFAVWTPTAPHHVIYAGNGNDTGDPPVDATAYYSGDDIVVSDIDPGSFTKAGLSFAGWSLSSNGTGPRYAASQTIKMGDGDVLLYAIWSRVLYVTPDIPAPYWYTLTVTQTGTTVPKIGATRQYTASYDGGRMGGYRWALDGTTIAGITTQYLNYTWTQSGPHVLTAFVTDANGYVYSGSLSVWVTK